MKEKFTLDITNIQIIAYKTEGKNFVFDNPKRAFDGFVMITSGKGFVTGTDGVRQSITKGDMIIVNLGDSYKIEFEEPCSYITSGLTIVTDKKLFSFIHRCNKKEYDEILKICDIWQSRSWDSYAKCRIKLMNFYINIIDENSLYKNVDTDIKNALEYIHRNFKKNFSGNDIASECSVSLSYLRGKFMKQTGMTVLKYRDSLRIAAAKEMLESGYFTASEIASELGYCDVYHFSKSFANQVGLSPRKWLNNI